jgi:cation diffusion facilitator CzcD-associated flavoprotein CzcO
VLPKLDKDYHEWEKRLAKRLPFVMYFYRFWLWLRSEVLLGSLMMDKPGIKKLAENMSKKFASEHIRDKQLLEQLIPDYPIGAKRILFSDNYYSALDRDNVALVTESISEVKPEGVCTSDGQYHQADVLIYATGFKASEFLAPIAVTGKNNRKLQDEWNNGAEAYLGISVNNFPNLFMLYGPNTNLGHNSIVIMIESQMRYILSCLKQMQHKKLKSVEINSSAQENFNRKIQQRLKTKTWSAIEKSWYIADGKIVNNWPGTTMEYWWRTHKCDLEKYTCS